MQNETSTRSWHADCEVADFDKPTAPPHRRPGEVKSRAIQKQQAEASGEMTRLSAYVLVGLLSFAGALYLLARLVGDDISLGGHSDSLAVSEIVIGNDVLNIPANVIRFREQRYAGAHARLELYLHWPSLSGYTPALRAQFNTSGDATNLVFVTLEQRSMSLDMSGRIAPIYARYFDGAPSDGGHGLVRQPLSAEGGYIDEDLYYEAVSPYPFATRCVREDSKISTPFCLRDVHMGKQLMMTYRFHKKFLPQWLDIERGLRHRIKAMLSAGES